MTIRRTLSAAAALAAVLCAAAATYGGEDPKPNPRRGPAPIVAPARPVEIAPAKPADADAALTAVLNQADLVFVGVVSEVVAGPVARSYPPIYTMRISFRDAKIIKGDPPGKAALSYRARQVKQPNIAKGDKLLVAAVEVPGRKGSFRITKLLPADEKNLKLARLAAKLPVGWSIVAGKPVSPFAALGKKAWPAGSKLSAEVVCSKSSRPGLLCGAGVKVEAKWVPPAKPVKWANPYGDGLFKVTVTNTGGKPVEVPALLTDAKGKILWADSLVIVWRGKGLLLPEAGAVPADAKAAKLTPGASVSAVINALKLRGVSWPRGGSRVSLRFCLGEKSGESFFYYLSRHHDKLRAGLRRE